MLSIATKNKSTDLIELLLDFYLNTKVFPGDTPLLLAVKNNDLEEIRIFLELGAYPFFKNNVTFMLMRAFIVAQILAHKSFEINKIDANGNTLISYAIENYNYNGLRLLIDKNADITIQNNVGDTALHIAAYRGDIGVVKSVFRQSYKYPFISLHLQVIPNFRG